MVTIINAGRVYKGKQYLELAGLSTDDKPVTGLLNGSLFHELDTTKIYAFNEEGDTGEEWIMQIQLTEQEASTSSSLGGSLGGGLQSNLQGGLLGGMNQTQDVPVIEFPEEEEITDDYTPEDYPEEEEPDGDGE